jgi:prepilin-type N-terminal cleavage/methylation domain-containing protein
MRIADCRTNLANCRDATGVGDGVRSPNSTPRRVPVGWLPAPRSFRRGVTLVELLITIMIIAVLAGLILGVAAVAGQTAREAHSRHMITRLHTLLTEHLATYKTRRVRLNPMVEQQINIAFANAPPARRGRAIAEARLYALREMMLMEVPDRWSDIILAPVGSLYRQPLYASERPSLSNVYLRRYLRLVNRVNSISDNTNTTEELYANQGAECLYLIITLACGDGEARTLFHESDIGDTDGDGAPEFLDGWGHPIEFLRWAPGFDSEIHANANELDNPATGTPQQAWQAAASADHDPFDIFRAQPNAFRLVPLIYSPGRDESSGLFSNPAFVVWDMSSPNFSVSPGVNPPYLQPPLNPYAMKPDSYLGTVSADGTATDNIHNHLLGER